ncbi:hypothetical protein HN51_039123, partial [Arachis hypogaea]
MAKTQRNDLTGPAKHATCHVSIKRIEIPFLPIERGKSPSPRSVVHCHRNLLHLYYRSNRRTHHQRSFHGGPHASSIPFQWFSIFLLPDNRVTTPPQLVRTILHCHRWRPPKRTSVPVSLELKDTVVRAYRTDPVQVRSCPSISLFDYINARVLLRTSDGETRESIV